jgi:hypothetical protein
MRSLLLSMLPSLSLCYDVQVTVRGMRHDTHKAGVSRRRCICPCTHDAGGERSFPQPSSWGAQGKRRWLQPHAKDLATIILASVATTATYTSSAFRSVAGAKTVIHAVSAITGNRYARHLCGEGFNSFEITSSAALWSMAEAGRPPISAYCT